MAADGFSRKWIIEKSQDVLAEYSSGITLRQLYYRLVARGMTNDIRHYQRVVGAMTDARWKDIVSMDAFIDRERSMFGKTEAEEKDLQQEINNAKTQIEAWMRGYSLNQWSNQPEYIEVWIEKKALQGVFENPCIQNSVGLAPCKGYPSITFLHEAAQRFGEISSSKEITILYFGDYDPSGEDIPRAIKDNLERMDCEVNVERIALNPDLIKELNLPSVPPKLTDSRTQNWDGAGAVELDAVEPRRLKQICERAIAAHFDTALYDELKEKEEEERSHYQKALKHFVKDIKG